jgi:hypothetical protein
MSLSFNEFIIIVIFLIIGWVSSTGVKTQFVRVLDVVIYGPLLIYVALNLIADQNLKLILLFMGATTISYNLKNFIAEKFK